MRCLVIGNGKARKLGCIIYSNKSMNRTEHILTLTKIACTNALSVSLTIYKFLDPILVTTSGGTRYYSEKNSLLHV